MISGEESSAVLRSSSKPNGGRMKTVAQAAVLQSLIERLGRIRPESQRRWGTLTAHEMLCHLGDAAEMCLRDRPRKKPVPLRRRRLMKWLALYAPFPWPRGYPTNPEFDPKREGTRPSQFAVDLKRAIAGVQGIATAQPETLEPAHGVFGTMSLEDWQRWAFKHTDHHLRQFGV
jgi:hypothetical protein